MYYITSPKLIKLYFPLNIREHFFYSESDQALAQIAWGDCEISILGDI